MGGCSNLYTAQAPLPAQPSVKTGMELAAIEWDKDAKAGDVVFGYAMGSSDANVAGKPSRHKDFAECAAHKPNPSAPRRNYYCVRQRDGAAMTLRYGSY